MQVDPDAERALQAGAVPSVYLAHLLSRLVLIEIGEVPYLIRGLSGHLHQSSHLSPGKEHFVRQSLRQP